MSFDLDSLLTQLRQLAISRGFPVLLIIGLGITGLKLIPPLSKRITGSINKRKTDSEQMRRTKTVSEAVAWTLRLLIIAIVTMMLLDQFSVDIGPILAAAGVLGLAVGFGAQNLVRDFISGFFILIEDQVRVGDVVEIGSHSGVVEHVHLRMVILRDVSGNVHFIRNSKIDIVTNMTKGFSRYVFDISVAYKEDIDEVIKVMRQVDEELRSDPAYEDAILEPLEVFGVQRFAESGVIIRARTKTKPIEQWRVGREYNKRLKRRFDELDIEIPVPHQKLYFGEENAKNALSVRADKANS